MSFQAYIDNIKAKTGKSPEDFRRAAQAQGLLGESYKAMALVAWLKSEFGLGHGHAMAVVQAFKIGGWVPATGGAPESGPKSRPKQRP